MRHATPLLAVLPFLFAAAAPAQVFSGRTDVVTVEVPVNVIRDGEPVRGLTAQDFAIYEGKKRQPITGFDAVDLARLTPGEDGFAVSDVRAAERRHFLMLFDLSFSDNDSVMRARAAARRLVAQDLHPTDLVAVAVYASGYGCRLILGFTSDRAQIDLAIASLGAPQIVNRSPETLSIVLGEVKEDYQGRRAAVESRGGELMELRLANLEQTLGSYVNEIRQRANVETRLLDERDRNQVVALTRSFADLGRLMREVAGRKYVLYLSEGFDSSLLLGGVAKKEAKDELQQSVEGGEVWQVDTDRLYGSTRLQGDLREMVQEFRQADCAIYAVDIGGVRASGGVAPERASGEDGLFIFANETGGELYRNENDLGRAMKRMLEATSVTYLLAFEPKNLQPDGSYHPIDVRLSHSLAGAKVIHRDGYFAPGAGGIRNPLEEKLEAAELILAGRAGGDLDLSVLAAPLGTSGDWVRVPVLVEVSGESLLRGHPGAFLSAEIYAYALTPEGAVAGFLAHSVSLNLLEVRERLEKTGLRFYGELQLPPGDYQLRVLVRDTQSREHSLSAVSLTVPDFNADPWVLMPPLPMGTSEGWILARTESGGGPYPFVVEGQPFVPAARLSLGPQEEASLCLLADGPGGRLAGARIEARVHTAAGGEVPGGSLAVVRPVESPIAGVSGMVTTFRPAGLAPGDYTLEVAVTDPASGRTAQSTLPLVIRRH